MPQVTIEQILIIAREHYRAGRFAEAEAIYRRILAEHPKEPEAWHMLGAIAHHAGKNEDAIGLISRAIALRPAVPDYHNNLGAVFLAAGKFDAAIASFQNAIKLKPNYPEAFNNLGITLTAKKDFNAAIQAHRRAVELNPDYADAYFSLGLALVRGLQLDASVEAFRTGSRYKPEAAAPYLDLGNIFLEQGRLNAAAEAYRTAIRIKPDFAEAHGNLGVVYRQMGRIEETLAECRAAVEYKPDDVAALSNLGNAYKSMGRLDEAVAAYRKCLQKNPFYRDAHSNLVFTLHYHPAYDMKAIYQERVDWSRRHADPLKKFIEPHANPDSHRDDPDRKLRIGYVSPDFRAHVVGQNFHPLLREHDREQFEIYCYSRVQRNDAMTEQMRSRAHAWRDIKNISDQQAARMIREDRIDILVDQAMHMAHTGLLIFAYKPAPVQVTFMAYPGTTGMGTIDYRMTDPYLDPPGLFDEFYSERSVRLPETFWCYDSLTRELQINELPALKNGYITFGCLNNFCKVNNQVLSLWARVLQVVPDSRLILLAPPGQAWQQTLAELGRNGVQPERVKFVPIQPAAEYLKSYLNIDFGLDTFPYNGHTTSLDGLWMGVPTITLIGNTVVGRAGFSQLSNLGLTELAARTPDEFVQIAVKLAGDLPRLKELRSTLRQRVQQSPLMDAKRFARNVEAAYRDMWKKWVEKSSAP